MTTARLRPGTQRPHDGIHTRLGSDDELLVGIRNRDVDALGEIYRRYSAIVHRSIARVLVDGETAEEIGQDLFARLWDQPDRFRPERGSLGAFLLMQARGRAIDALRSESARRRRERLELQVLDTIEDVEESALTVAAVDAIRSAVAALPAEKREVIELAYFSGMTYRDVAATLSSPEGTIKSRIRSALRQMRSELVPV